MPRKSTGPLIVIHNPESTRADKIERQVFAPQEDYNVPYEVYHTLPLSTEGNIAAMQDALPDHATVISAGGDGTAMQLVNASMRGRKNLTLGFMPLGNFNDIARTHADRNQTVLDIINARTTVMTRPLTIEVDGEYWRHAPAYLTLGWTALAASEFGGSDSREAMKGAPASLKLVKSLGQLAHNYYSNRHHVLPPFVANGDVHNSVTDILAINSPRVGNIVRSPDRYYEQYFGARANINVASILPNIPFGLKAISGRTPLDRVESLRLVFQEVASLPVQTEGEFAEMTAREIYIYKNQADHVSVLHPKASR